ncbi:type II secretion system F family protein [uncultured Ilyobacter sp.]|uniref:type II secretion system F family protein n=1 Tax=uncultured Ilyobacter sp. TaxID=544433 RepID=UPI0029C971BB|nr:type II secretion system F family protein [uncultured Ilyobacter sp.]
MPKYKYRARDKNGHLIDGEMEAANESELNIGLDNLGHFLISVQSQDTVLGGDILAPFKKVKIKEMTQFTTELSTLIEAGISIVSALEIEVRQLKGGILKNAISTVIEDIKGGESFSEALSKHPKVFKKIYTGLVKSGEVSGQLDSILLDLAKYLDVNYKNRSKVKSAVIYPCVMFVVALAVSVFLLVVVLPSFVSVFENSGVSLPFPTRILLNLSVFMKTKWYLMLGGIAFVIALIRLWYTTPDGRHTIDGYKLKAPIFGSLMKKSVVSRFTRTFGALMKSSVPMLHALDILKESIENAVVEEVVDKMKVVVSEGGRVSKELEESEYFPAMVSRMVAVGENTGELDKMLLKISDHYDNELENDIKGLTSIIEPILIVFMGIVVGSIVLAVMLPMFDMIKLVK